MIHQNFFPARESLNPALIRRILVVRNDNVGDVLCCTPGIRALRRAFPQAYIAALVVNYSRDAISGNPDLDEVMIYEKAKHRPDQSRIFSLYKQFLVERRVKKKQFDLAIGMRSTFSWSEAWLVYFSGARFRLGYEPVKNTDRWFDFFYNIRVPLPPPEIHEVEKNLHLLEFIGVKPGEKHLQVNIPHEERLRVESFMKRNGIEPDQLIGFHLSSRKPANRWSSQHFSSLAYRLVHDKQRKVILTWGPGDEDLARRIQAEVGPGVFLYSTPNFKSLGALQEKCRVFLSPDGGAMHFATAVGTPTVGLFGKTNPEMWGPWGKGHLALRKGPHADMISMELVYQSLEKWI